MKIFDKTLKEYFHFIEIPLILILIISIFQSVSILLKDFFPFIDEIVISDNFYFFKRNFVNPIAIFSIFELVISFCFGFYLVAKKRFRLSQNFVSGILFYFSSLLVFFFIPLIFPHIQFIFQLMSYCTLFLLSLILFILASVVGGILAKIYLTLKESSYRRRLHSQSYKEDKTDRKPIQRFKY